MPVRGKNGGNRGQGSKWITRKRRLAIYLRDRFRCVWCTVTVRLGRTGPDLASLDHVRPRDNGGTNETGNLVTCCMKCNRLRGNKTAEDWAFELCETRGDDAPVILARVLEAVTLPLEVANHQSREVGGD